MSRVYLDYNATAPLRPEARDAMLAAMDMVGNPSSVHAEGRRAKAIVEKARGQVAALVGCEPTQLVFTGSATEAAQTAVQAFGAQYATICAGIEHDAVWAHKDRKNILRIHTSGTLALEDDFDRNILGGVGPLDAFAIQAANSETGVLQDVAGAIHYIAERLPRRARFLCDAVQIWGKAGFCFSECGADAALLSAHKLGGPKGVGALAIQTGIDDFERTPLIEGGGQEMGRRSGTENVIGIAGFGAAAAAAQQDVAAGKWDRVEKLRNILENALAAASKTTIFVGKEAPRLPNTSCFITPEWKGETQVMQMDLAGFAVSAGSACSSGKVKASRVLKAMGYSDTEAASAVRVSLGLETTEDDVLRFADAWTEKFKKHEARAA
ncbi:MAG: cysteine desulfurase family protein [Pseudomonadota bacterium]